MIETAVSALLAFVAGGCVGAVLLATYLMRTYGPKALTPKAEVPRASAAKPKTELEERKERNREKFQRIKMLRFPEQYYRDLYFEAKAIREKMEANVEEAREIESSARKEWKKYAYHQPGANPQ